MNEKKELPEEELDEIRFINLIIMFSEGTMQYLGKVANPLTGKCEQNLEAAAGTIDLIQTLKKKTQGNLSENESKILSNVLTNLQLNYVDEVKKKEEKKDEEKRQDPEETKNA